MASASPAEGASPGRFQAQGEVRPISTAESDDWNRKGTAAEGGVLRWRVKQPTTQSGNVSVLKPTPQSAARRTASRQQAAGSPFADPFGDRYPVRQAQFEDAAEDAPALEPAEEMNEVPEAPPMRSRPAPLFGPAQPEPMEDAQPMLDPVPDPMPMAEDFGQPEALPEGNFFGDEVYRNRKYNNLNCEAHGAACEDSRLRSRTDLLRNKGKGILDISPPLSLASDQPDQRETDVKRAERIPAREWRDLSGQLVGYGKLVGVRFGHAVVETSSGEVELSLRELGENERCFVAAWWEFPAECILSYEPHPGRNFVPSTMTWTASALCHKPLYFEETQLERYGHTAGPIVQPFLSGAHFFLNIAVMPYKMGINPPHECQYALGYYRPGSCAPWMIPPIPLSVRGAAAQAAAVGVGVPLIP